MPLAAMSRWNVPKLVLSFGAATLIVLLPAVPGPGAAGTAAAQASTGNTGTISGLVRDAESHEPLIGVDLVLVGVGAKTATDIDGRFAFGDLAAGKYELRLTYLGYNTKFLTGLEVSAGRPLGLTVDLESFKAFATDDMVV